MRFFSRQSLLTFSLVCFFLPAVTFAAREAAQPVPVKQLHIFNNSNEIIYPVIETSIHDVADHWLMAQFQQTNPAFNYIQNRVNRVYVNPVSGLAPGESVKINVPFYTTLLSNPDPTLPNQYIDWWNGMRVYLYDDVISLTNVYMSDSMNPVQPFSAGLSCDAGSVCEPLTIFYNSVGLPQNDPYQLTEYTFANVVTANGLPYSIDANYVDYDISYVDHTYLPVAMEPLGNPDVGYTGTTMDLSSFRSKLALFVTDESWPVYIKTPGYPDQRIPGTYNVLIGTDLSHSPVSTQLLANWNSCTSDDCKQVKNLFDRNAANYQLICHSSAPSPLEYLQHVYGWVPFECLGHGNTLVDTPEGNYQQAFNSYQALQYGLFNPYVKLIHDSGYIGMNAYAFSIDDAVGNMNQTGTGVVITMGGAKGLPNSLPFDPDAVVNVNLGAPASGSSAWISYGICKSMPDKQLQAGMLNFQILTVSYPCEISLRDSNNVTYHFTVKRQPPYAGKDKSAFIECKPGDQWCRAINVDFNTQHDINTPPAS